MLVLVKSQTEEYGDAAFYSLASVSSIEMLPILIEDTSTKILEHWTDPKEIEDILRTEFQEIADLASFGSL